MGILLETAKATHGAEAEGIGVDVEKRNRWRAGRFKSLKNGIHALISNS